MGGDYVSICLSLSICLFVCEQLYSNTTEWICMKFCVWLWYAIRKKQLTFGSDPEPDSDLSVSACLSACLSVFLSACLSVYLPVCLPVCLYVCLCVYVSDCVSVCLCVCVCVSVCQSICQSVRL